MKRSHILRKIDGVDVKMGAGKTIGIIILLIIILLGGVFALEYFQIYSVPYIGPVVRDLIP